MKILSRVRGEICRFFRIELIKIKLIGRNVSFFVNRKQVVNRSTLTYSTLLGTTKGFLHT